MDGATFMDRGRTSTRTAAKASHHPGPLGQVPSGACLLGEVAEPVPGLLRGPHGPREGTRAENVPQDARQPNRRIRPISHEGVDAVRQIQDDGKGRPDQAEQPRGRERPGHQPAEHRARLPDRGVHQEGPPRLGLVPLDRLDPRPGKGIGGFQVMAFYGEPQWAVVGDTFPVGCAWADSIVYRETSFEDNPDGEDSRYNTKYGMYEAKCGMDKLLMSWGHDEYLYRVLVHNNAKLPNQALAMIRYHSFYPWHAGGDYMHFCTAEDMERLKWINEFNKYDLYTKSGEMPDIEKLWPYYEKLIDKYIPGVLEW
ncbi:myo-inositol oxygenase isoform X1 [Andrena cerasifolii]|uniref:myo-inositol oxygenase isoform X1 n=1 Tax=Andrena cerasifolii TaxID=2819439 RepID=UPI004037ED55